MPLLDNGAFVDLRLLTVALNGELIVLHYLVRRSLFSNEPQYLFILREVDVKLIALSTERLNPTTSHGCRRSIVNQFQKHQHIWARPEEVKIFKILGLFPAHTPKVTLIEPHTVVSLLHHFGEELKALLLEGVFISLVAEQRYLFDLLRTIKLAVHDANNTFNVNHDAQQTVELLKQFNSSHFSLNSPPNTQSYYINELNSHGLNIPFDGLPNQSPQVKEGEDIVQINPSLHDSATTTTTTPQLDQLPPTPSQSAPLPLEITTAYFKPESTPVFNEFDSSLFSNALRSPSPSASSKVWTSLLYSSLYGVENTPNDQHHKAEPSADSEQSTSSSQRSTNHSPTLAHASSSTKSPIPSATSEKVEIRPAYDNNAVSKPQTQTQPPPFPLHTEHYGPSSTIQLISTPQQHDSVEIVLSYNPSPHFLEIAHRSSPATDSSRPIELQSDSNQASNNTSTPTQNPHLHSLAASFSQSTHDIAARTISPHHLVSFNILNTTTDADHFEYPPHPTITNSIMQNQAIPAQLIEHIPKSPLTTQSSTFSTFNSLLPRQISSYSPIHYLPCPDQYTLPSPDSPDPAIKDLLFQQSNSAMAPAPTFPFISFNYHFYPTLTPLLLNLFQPSQLTMTAPSWLFQTYPSHITNSTFNSNPYYSFATAKIFTQETAQKPEKRPQKKKKKSEETSWYATSISDNDVSTARPPTSNQVSQISHLFMDCHSAYFFSLLSNTSLSSLRTKPASSYPIITPHGPTPLEQADCTPPANPTNLRCPTCSAWKALKRSPFATRALTLDIKPGDEVSQTAIAASNILHPNEHNHVAMMPIGKYFQTHIDYPITCLCHIPNEFRFKVDRALCKFIKHHLFQNLPIPTKPLLPSFTQQVAPESLQRILQHYQQQLKQNPALAQTLGSQYNLGEIKDNPVKPILTALLQSFKFDSNTLFPFKLGSDEFVPVQEIDSETPTHLTDFLGDSHMMSFSTVVPFSLLAALAPIYYSHRHLPNAQASLFKANVAATLTSTLSYGYLALKELSKSKSAPSSLSPDFSSTDLLESIDNPAQCGPLGFSDPTNIPAGVHGMTKASSADEDSAPSHLARASFAHSQPSLQSQNQHLSSHLSLPANSSAISNDSTPTPLATQVSPLLPSTAVSPSVNPNLLSTTTANTSTKQPRVPTTFPTALPEPYSIPSQQDLIRNALTWLCSELKQPVTYTTTLIELNDSTTATLYAARPPLLCLPDLPVPQPPTPTASQLAIEELLSQLYQHSQPSSRPNRLTGRVTSQFAQDRPSTPSSGTVIQHSNPNSNPNFRPPPHIPASSQITATNLSNAYSRTPYRVQREESSLMYSFLDDLFFNNNDPYQDIHISEIDPLDIYIKHLQLDSILAQERAQAAEQENQFPTSLSRSKTSSKGANPSSSLLGTTSMIQPTPPQKVLNVGQLSRLPPKAKRDLLQSTNSTVLKPFLPENCDSVFPYTITLETLPLWRTFLFHLESLSTIQRFRLFRHAVLFWPLHPDDLPSLQSPSEEQAPLTQQTKLLSALSHHHNGLSFAPCSNTPSDNVVCPGIIRPAQVPLDQVYKESSQTQARRKAPARRDPPPATTSAPRPPSTSLTYSAARRGGKGEISQPPSAVTDSPSRDINNYSTLPTPYPQHGFIPVQPGVFQPIYDPNQEVSLDPNHHLAQQYYLQRYLAQQQFYYQQHQQQFQLQAQPPQQFQHFVQFIPSLQHGPGMQPQSLQPTPVGQYSMQYAPFYTYTPGATGQLGTQPQQLQLFPQQQQQQQQLLKVPSQQGQGQVAGQANFQYPQPGQHLSQHLSQQPPQQQYPLLHQPSTLAQPLQMTNQSHPHQQYAQSGPSLSLPQTQAQAQAQIQPANISSAPQFNLNLNLNANPQQLQPFTPLPSNLSASSFQPSQSTSNRSLNISPTPLNTQSTQSPPLSLAPTLRTTMQQHQPLPSLLQQQQSTTHTNQHQQQHQQQQQLSHFSFLPQQPPSHG